MRALSLCVLVLTLAALAAFVEQARACSCAVPDPRSALAAADGAFVGTMISRRETADFRAILTFEVERALKGSLGKRVDVVTARDSAGCGLEMPVGTRTGLVLDRRDGAWHGHLCAQFAPADLFAAAQPLPAPNGKGPVALFVGGRFGPARLMALDSLGRTLAYGGGNGTTTLIASCPGGRRLVEVASVDGGWRLALRDRRTLRFVRTRQLALGSGLVPSGLACEDVAGTRALVFGKSGDDTARAQIVRYRPSGKSVLWAGTAVSAAVMPGSAYIAAGKLGRALVAIDLETGRAANLGRIPPFMGSLVASPDGTRLAGVAYSAPGPGAPPSRAVVVDLERRPVSVRVASLGSANVAGEVVWLDDRRLAVFPSGEVDVVRVYDTAMRVQASFSGWSARGAAQTGRWVYGVGWDGRLLRATMPDGPVRTARRLPSPTAYTIVAV